MKILLLLVVLLPLSAVSQISPDSLKMTLAGKGTATEKTRIAHEIIDSYQRNQLDSTRKYLDIAYTYARQSGNVQLLARTYILDAVQYMNISQYKECLAFCHQAIRLYKSIDDNRGLGSAHNLMGHLYKVMGDAQNVDALTKTGIKYELLAINYFKKAEDTLGLIRAYNNLGIAYRDLDELTKTRDSYNNGLNIAKQAGIQNLGVGILYANLGQLYIDEGKNLDLGISLLEKAGVIHQKFNNQQAMEHTYRNLAEGYRKKKEYSRAIAYAQKSVDLAKLLKDTHRSFNAYQMLYSTQKDAGLDHDALINLEIAKTLEDSTMRIDKSRIIAEMEAKYQSVLKDSKIKILNKNAELDAVRKQSLIAAILLISLAAIITLSLLIQKRNRERTIYIQEKDIELQKLKNTEQELEFKKKELTAKVLQLARKNEFLGTIEGEIKALKNQVDTTVDETSNRIRRLIQRDMANDDQWEQFSQEFSSVHQGFLDTLVNRYGTFSKSEIRLVSLLKMNLSSKDIADTLNISDEGIKKARYRLRKKLALESEDDLQGFLQSFT